MTDTSTKAGSAVTQAIHAAARASLPFEDTEDFALAARGLIEAVP